MSAQTVEIQRWVKRGGMLLNCEALEISDPDHIYNQIVRQGGIPELFGFEHPDARRFDGMTRHDLIARILELEAENLAMQRAGF